LIRRARHLARRAAAAIERAIIRHDRAVVLLASRCRVLAVDVTERVRRVLAVGIGRARIDALMQPEMRIATKIRARFCMTIPIMSTNLAAGCGLANSSPECWPFLRHYRYGTEPAGTIHSTSWEVTEAIRSKSRS
jgi:hypothetical protein